MNRLIGLIVKTTCILSDGGWRQASNANFWALRKSKRISDTTQLVNVVFQAPGSCWGEVVIPFSESWHAEMW